MAMFEEGKTENGITTKTKGSGLDADVVQIGDYTFQVIVDTSKSDDGSFFLIRATEITSKDIFEFKRDEKTLLSMNWPNRSMDSVKQFITSTIFDPDEEMTVEYGFVKKPEKNDAVQEEKKVDEDDAVKLSKVYQEGDDMVILIELQYKWMRSSWRLDLKYVPQDEVNRLKVLVKELREEINTLQLREEKNMSNLREEINTLKSFQHGFKGMITMWSGNASQIPNGWAMCDGQNGTPDLRDRFILGGNANSIGSRGGSKTHSHNITVNGHRLTIQEIPNHNHKIEVCLGGISGSSTPAVTSPGGNSSFSKTESWGDFHTYTVGGGNTHSHSASSNSINHLPPYCVLGFIMKL